MKFKLPYYLLFILSVFFFSCSDDSDDEFEEIIIEVPIPPNPNSLQATIDGNSYSFWNVATSSALFSSRLTFQGALDQNNFYPRLELRFLDTLSPDTYQLVNNAGIPPNPSITYPFPGISYNISADSILQMISGELILNNMDTVAKRFSGTFNGTLQPIGDTTVSLQLTNGVFSGEYL